MSKFSDSVLNIIREKGWLTLGHMVFDDSVCFVANSRGNVAYSSDTGSFYWFSAMSIFDTNEITSKMLASDTKHIDCIASLVQSNENFLRQVSYNLGYRSSLIDEAIANKKQVPYPKFPKPNIIKAMNKNAETGLYDGYPYIEFGTSDSYAVQEGVKVSVIEGLEASDSVYTGADNNCLMRIDELKDFYEQHDRFCDFLKTNFALKNVL